MEGDGSRKKREGTEVAADKIVGLEGVEAKVELDLLGAEEGHELNELACME